MAVTTEDAEGAAERLEAALERIARAARPPALEGHTGVPSDLRDRLDRIIRQLRHVLETPT